MSQRAWNRAKACDSARGTVGDVGLSDKGKKVVRAEAAEGKAAKRHEVGGGSGKGGEFGRRRAWRELGEQCREARGRAHGFGVFTEAQGLECRGEMFGGSHGSGLTAPMADPGFGAQRLHEALQRLQSANPEASRVAAGEALEAFTLANDRTGAAASHQVLAILSLGRGDLESALAHVDAAIPLREGTGDWEGVAALWQERFELLLRVGDLDAARASAEHHLDATQKGTDKEAQAHALHQLAQVLLQQGDDGRAEAMVQQGLWLMDGPAGERGRAALHHLYANVWAKRGEYDRALGHARSSLDLARQANFRPAEIDALQQVGAMLAAAGKNAEARRALDEALVGRELLKDAEGRAAVLRELAGLAFADGRIDEGFGHLDYAGRSLREAGNVVGEVTLLQLSQSIADEQGRPEHALRLGEQLLDAAARTGDAEAAAAAHFTLATRFAAGQELDRAQAHFSTAMEAQEKLGLEHAAAVSRGMLGQVIVVTGRRDEGLLLIRASLGELERQGSEAAQTLREILTEIEAGD